jgi:endonuclease III
MVLTRSHIFRITRSLGWIPAEATRETAHSHLNARIPARLRYDVSPVPRGLFYLELYSR